jgi:Tol biopolymer transport system component
MPLVGPAPDGVGTILFPVREKKSFFVGLYAIHTNAAGMPIDPPMRRSAEVQFEWGDIHIAPDGRRVAVGNGWTIAILNNTDKSLRGPLREKASPLFYFYDWHPDSRHILLRADGGMGGVWLVDTDTGDYTELATDYSSSVFCAGAVSPDGQRVIYSRRSGMQSEVWIVATNGDSPTLVSTGMAPCAFAWSPDGSKIAFMGNGLQVMNADGSNLHTLSRHAVFGHLIRPVWSPDSQTLAFIARDGPLPSNDKNATPPGRNLREWEDRQDFIGTNIHVVNVNTGVERRLLSGTGNIDPAWSPDGRHIVFASTRGVSDVGASEIWMVDADGTHLRQLTHLGLRTRYPAWVKPAG